MKNSVIIGALLAVAGTAMGQNISQGNFSFLEKSATEAGVYAPQAELAGGVTPFDVTGIPSNDAFGAPGNVVVNYDLAAALGYASGTPITMNGIGWNVDITAFGASWLSEVAVGFDDPATPGTGINLRPGAGNDAPGGPANFQNAVVKFPDVGLPNIFLPTGVLRMEFFEGFDDAAGVQDGLWNGGNLFIQTVELPVPAPGVAGLFGIAGLAAARRRRS